MKKIFIAATKQNDGKTTLSLGLLCNFRDRFKGVGFIKPIGQRYLEEDGQKVDEDSILIEKVMGVKCLLKDMSPIAVDKGFTEKYIVAPDKKNISSQIKQAYNRVARQRDLMVIEGTGHAGVGSVFDHSNATVARLLGSKVIIISSGGVGRPIDEIVLNKALFEREGVKVLGAIVNKVLSAKFDKVSRLVRRGLQRKGIPVLGVIPYSPVLARPTFEQVLEEDGFELVCGKEYLERPISQIIVGAMKPYDAVKYITDDSLLITPGDREDMISAALGCFRSSDDKRLRIAGMVLSGGIMPDAHVLETLKNAQLPVLFAKSDTYDVAMLVHDLTIKIRPCDTDKINAAVQLVKEHVNLDEILKGI
jgi:BioD-like phosphotransacetylase family protein